MDSLRHLGTEIKRSKSSRLNTDARVREACEQGRGEENRKAGGQEQEESAGNKTCRVALCMYRKEPPYTLELRSAKGAINLTVADTDAG